MAQVVAADRTTKAVVAVDQMIQVAAVVVVAVAVANKLHGSYFRMKTKNSSYRHL